MIWAEISTPHHNTTHLTLLLTNLNLTIKYLTVQINSIDTQNKLKCSVPLDFLPCSTPLHFSKFNHSKYIIFSTLTNLSSWSTKYVVWRCAGEISITNHQTLRPEKVPRHDSMIVMTVPHIQTIIIAWTLFMEIGSDRSSVYRRGDRFYGTPCIIPDETRTVITGGKMVGKV